jgi:type II secretion system protein H
MRRRGFTLLEILAVVTILGLIAMMLLPGLGRVGSGDLDHEARRLAAALELARQRAVATRAPHRLLLDVPGGVWRVEWSVSEARAQGLPETETAPLDLRGDAPVSLVPPGDRELRFHPVPNQFGRDSALEGDVFFEGVETPEGWLESGEVSVEFDVDGTTEPAVIRLADADGRALRVEVLPLADAVRVVHDVL